MQNKFTVLPAKASGQTERFNRVWEKYRGGVYKIMRITTAQILMAALFTGFAFARAGNAQVLDTKVSVKLQSASLQDALMLLEEKAAVKFVYSASTLELSQEVTLNAADEKLGDILTRMLEPLSIKYTVKENNFIVLRKDQKTTDGEKPAQTGMNSIPDEEVLLLAVSGKVTDRDGAPMPGVNVVQKGTAIGTSTDSDGTYRIDVSDNAVLVFSFIGYNTVEIPVGNRTVIDVSLEIADRALSEIVVVGYGYQEKSDLTGSVASVKSEDIERIPVTSVNQALQGRAAGVQIRQTQQQPGGQLSVRIRGISSIRGNTEPLYVIDGIIGGSLTTLNPQDIASLEVLKDASATAIFGANGANGVVLITTKRGKPDKAVIDFSSYVGVQQVRRRLDLLNAREYAAIDIARRNLLGQEQVYDLNNLPADTDWQDLIYQSAPIQNYNLSASGGTQKVRYFASANYIDQQGVVVNTDYSRFNLRMNLDAEMSKRLKVGARVGLSRDNRGRMNGEGALNNDSPIAGATLLAPVLSPFDSEGRLSPEIEYATLNTSTTALMQNPLHYSKYLIDVAKSTAISGSTFAEVMLAKGLHFKPSFNFTLSSGKSNYYKSSTIFTNSLGYRNEARVSSSDSYRWNTDMILTYETSFSDDHKLEALGGFIVNKSYNESLSSAVRDFALDVFEYHNLAGGTNILNVGSGMSEKQQLSYIGRVNYSLFDKFLFSFNGRYDGSSVFGVNNRWGFFPSGAIAWKLGEESFIRDMGLFSDLKIRTSYGISGSEALSPYSSLARLTSSPAYIINGVQVVGYRPSSIAVPDLQWEETAQLDIGLDAGFFDGRVGITADFYRKNTSKLFLSVPLPRTSGVSSVVKNTGSLQNTGVEVHLTGAVLQGNFTWDTDINISFQNQKVTNIGNAREILLSVGLEGFSDAQIIKVGEPLGTFYGYPNAGIWQISDLEGVTTVPNQFGVPVQPGDLKYIDQNGDGDVNSDDRRILGYALPKFFGGWSNTFRYKGFDASFFFDFVYGNDIFNVNRYHTMMTIRHFTNKEREFKNYWTPENPSNTVPRLDYNQPASSLSDYLMEDGSYIRLREATLGYSLPDGLLSTLKMNRLRVYLSGTNLLILTKYSGYNPDVNAYASDSGIFNVDFGSYPMYSTFLAGINIGF